MRSSRLPLVAAVLGLAACMDHPPPASAPPEVTASTAEVPLAQIPPATVERYPGTYRSGGETLAIRLVAGQLFAARPGRPDSALKLVGLGTFADAAGTAYLFLPADGSGGRLATIDAAGARRDWAR